MVNRVESDWVRSGEKEGRERERERDVVEENENEMICGEKTYL